MIRFRDLVWRSDRMLLDGWVFRLEHDLRDDWELGDDCFRFFKTRELMRQYERFWEARQAVPGSVSPAHVLELGIWDGGSAALWCELLGPRKLVSIDGAPRTDSPYFRRFRKERGHEQRLKTFWRTDQADSDALKDIVRRELGGTIDLVIDDASHDYTATKASFEILFPFLPPGGLYVIEDWSWPHWIDFQRPDHPWVEREPLSRFAAEIVHAAGTMLDARPDLIGSVTIYRDFMAIERGARVLRTEMPFRLADYTLHRPRDG